MEVYCVCGSFLTKEEKNSKDGCCHSCSRFEECAFCTRTGLRRDMRRVGEIASLLCADCNQIKMRLWNNKFPRNHFVEDSQRVVVAEYIVYKEKHDGYCSYPRNERVKRRKEIVFFGLLKIFEVQRNLECMLIRDPEKIHNFCCGKRIRYKLVKFRVRTVKPIRTTPHLKYVIRKSLRKID